MFVLLLLFWVFLALAQGPAFFVDLKKWFSLCLRVCRVLMFLLPLCVAFVSYSFLRVGGGMYVCMCVHIYICVYIYMFYMCTCLWIASGGFHM